MMGMVRMRAVIGVDGGGTKTRAVMMDAQGVALARAEGGSLNYHFIPVAQAAGNLIAVIESLQAQTPCEITALGIGDPTAGLHELAKSRESEAFLALVRGALRLPAATPMWSMCDVYMALYGLTRGRPGVMMIGGTGSMGAAIDGAGHVHSIGGWGIPTNDPGSAYDIAVQGLHAVFRAHDDLLAPTRLTQAACDFFGCACVQDLVALFNADGRARGQIAAFAKAVAECAVQGDAAALGIEAAAARALSEYICALLQRIKVQDCTVGLCGGVLEHNARIRDRVVQCVQSQFPRVQITRPPIPPEEGAAWFAWDRLKPQEGCT